MDQLAIRAELSAAKRSYLKVCYGHHETTASYLEAEKEARGRVQRAEAALKRARR